MPAKFVGFDRLDTAVDMDRHSAGGRCVRVVFFLHDVDAAIRDLVFLRGSAEVIRVALVMGCCVSAGAAIGVVPVFWNKSIPTSSRGLLAGISRVGFLSRLSVSVLTYVALYLLFGYYVAWPNPELRVLYGGDAGDVRGFWEHVTSPPVLNRVIPLQLVRGLVWTLLGVWMIRFSTGSRWTLAV